MERYKVLEELGDGTCGSVYKAINMGTYEIVAVKKMKRKFYSWEECMNLREVKEYNLYQIMRGQQKPFSEEEIRVFMTQVMQGLAHMHKNGYFHRDLKPENLLVTNDVIKIADFGLAREVSSMPPFTDYVSTRWYRAPEVLLQALTYTPAIDMWAVGAVLAELFTLCPIFPGESEIDQLYKICCVLGTPDWTTFSEARDASLLINASRSEIMPTNLYDMIPNASLEAIDLIKQLCSWDPLRRPTADQALQHPFFHVVGMRIPRPIWDPLQLKLSSMEPPPNLELKLWDFGTQPDDCFLGLTLAVKPSVSNLAISHKASKGTREDIVLYSGFQDHPRQSVFWSLVSPDQNGITPSVESSLSLSFSSIPHSSIGVPQSLGFTIASLQPNLAVSSPLQQQGTCL